MELMVQLVCPECNEHTSLNVVEFAPGHRPACQSCQTPARLTPDTLARLRRDLRDYCKT